MMTPMAVSSQDPPLAASPLPPAPSACAPGVEEISIACPVNSVVQGPRRTMRGALGARAGGANGANAARVAAAATPQQPRARPAAKAKRRASRLQPTPGRASRRPGGRAPIATAGRPSLAGGGEPLARRGLPFPTTKRTTKLVQDFSQASPPPCAVDALPPVPNRSRRATPGLLPSAAPGFADARAKSTRTPYHSSPSPRPLKKTTTRTGLMARLTRPRPRRRTRLRRRTMVLDGVAEEAAS